MHNFKKIFFYIFFIVLFEYANAQKNNFIYFDFDKFNLNEVAKTTLHNILLYDNIKAIKIKGYTDSVGNIKYNNALSLKRANTVKAYVQNKWHNINITIAPLGETIDAPNDALNRRVEIEIIGFLKNIQVEDSLPLQISKEVPKAIQKIAFNKIYFEPNTHIFKLEAKKQLEELYLNVLKLGNKKIEIRGHINWPKSFGSFEDDNDFKNLSLNRAKAVYKYLKEKGVAMQNIGIRGMDNTEMIYPYATQMYQMEANMRVEIVLLEE